LESLSLEYNEVHLYYYLCPKKSMIALSILENFVYADLILSNFIFWEKANDISPLFFTLFESFNVS